MDNPPRRTDNLGMGDRVDGGEGSRVTPARRARQRVLLVAALCTLVLAVNHFVLHWVLFTDALIRRFLFHA
jgi:hypothetical protein